MTFKVILSFQNSRLYYGAIKIFMLSSCPQTHKLVESLVRLFISQFCSIDIFPCRIGGDPQEMGEEAEQMFKRISVDCGKKEDLDRRNLLHKFLTTKLVGNSNI